MTGIRYPSIKNLFAMLNGIIAGFQLRIGAVILPALMLQGCYIFYPPSYNPPPGILYENTALNYRINTPTDLGNKTGSSCIKSYLGLVSTGNATVQAAAASKGIRMIKALDYQRTSILAGAYTKLCTIVHGE